MKSFLNNLFFLSLTFILLSGCSSKTNDPGARKALEATNAAMAVQVPMMFYYPAPASQ